LSDLILIFLVLNYIILKLFLHGTVQTLKVTSILYNLKSLYF